MDNAYKYGLLIAILFFSVFATSQKRGDSLSIVETLKYDGVSIFNGIKHTYSRPFHWQHDDFVTLSQVTLGSAFIFAFDEPLNEVINKQGAGIPDVVKDVGFRFGKPLFNYGMTTGIYTIGLLTKSEKIRRTGVLLITANTTGGLLQTFTKTVAGRARPSSGDKTDWRPFDNRAGYHSFPSGHSILAFTTMYALSKQFESKWVKAGLLALGTLTPISRMWANQHWASDIFLGIAISIITVDSADNYLKKAQRYTQDRSSTKISWRFTAGAGQVGVIGTF